MLTEREAADLRCSFTKNKGSRDRNDLLDAHDLLVLYMRPESEQGRKVDGCKMFKCGRPLSNAQVKEVTVPLSPVLPVTSQVFC